MASLAKNTTLTASLERSRVTPEHEVPGKNTDNVQKPLHNLLEFDLFLTNDKLYAAGESRVL